jgi:hypothetical protein
MSASLAAALRDIDIPASAALRFLARPFVKASVGWCSAGFSSDELAGLVGSNEALDARLVEASVTTTPLRVVVSVTASFVRLTEDRKKLVMVVCLVLVLAQASSMAATCSLMSPEVRERVDTILAVGGRSSDKI